MIFVFFSLTHVKEIFSTSVLHDICVVYCLVVFATHPLLPNIRAPHTGATSYYSPQYERSSFPTSPFLLPAVSP